MSVFIEIILGLIVAVIGLGIVTFLGVFIAVFIGNVWTDYRKTRRRH